MKQIGFQFFPAPFPRESVEDGECGEEGWEWGFPSLGATTLCDPELETFGGLDLLATSAKEAVGAFPPLA